MQDTSTEQAVERPALKPSTPRSRSIQRVRESAIRLVLIACGSFSVLITITIIVVLFSEAGLFFSRTFHTEGGEPYRVTPVEFFTGTEWSPLLGSKRHYGVWALICGTMLVTAVAMAVALPLGLITAVFLSEYAPRQLRAVLKPVLEVLAGIPTVVYGFFALWVITPSLQSVFFGFDSFNAFSAGLAVGILCLPTVTSLSEDALQAVPRSLREAAYGLGGTRFDVSLKVVVPAALSGVISAFLLAIARAIGETMIVALAAGNRAQLTIDPRKQVQTMTGFIAQMSDGDMTNFGPEYFSSYAVAATLFAITFAITILGNVIRKRFREVYQ